MERRRFIVSAISASVVGTALATDACSTNGFSGSFNPSALGLDGGGARRVHTLSLRYAINNVAGYNLRTRTYNGGTYGPTIETRPGETLAFEIVNKLPPNPPVSYPEGSVPIPMVTNEAQVMDPASAPLHPSGKINRDNNPHGFNTTNLHVHGIQTVPHLFTPVGTSDPSAMMIEIEPGQRYRYTFPVPSDHPSGLFWYHPHKHGSTDVQVSGGMAGLIVMRGPIDEVPEIAAAREIFMVLQSLEVNPSPKNPHLYEREYKPYKTIQKGGYNAATDYTMLTLNGQGVCWVNYVNGVNSYTQVGLPEFHIAPGEVVRLRMLNGCNQFVLALALAGFDVWQIGFDGVNLLRPARFDMSGSGVTTITHKNLFASPVQILAPGNRIELLLRAPSKPGTYSLQSMASTNVATLKYNPPAFDWAQFVVRGKPVRMTIPGALPVPSREYPLIEESEIVAKRRFVFKTVFPSKVLLVGVDFTINGELYEMLKCPMRVRTGTCEEWRIENAVSYEIHPFHIHTNSFQLIAINDQRVDPVQIWDTFAVPPKVNGKNGSITIRIRFKQWRGKVVFHCHVLDHEDCGMMRNFLMA
jgi:suppressor of ftsI